MRPRLIDHPDYILHKNMKNRCKPGNFSNVKYYKNISVCAEWESFTGFLRDMGPRPTKQHTIDRIDNTKGYSKENCRWATRYEQVLNRSVICQETRDRKSYGIYYHKKKNKFIARIPALISPTGKRQHVGEYNSLEDAQKAINLKILKNNIEGGAK